MKKIVLYLFAGAILFSCSKPQEKPESANISEIAEEAYTFAYPMLEHYKMMFAMAMYKESGAYEAPFNVLTNMTELSGPQDTIIVRPNNDTFYSAVWFDLRNQPYILEVPEITDGRYYSFQLIDMYTHNIGYIGSRATGLEEGAYLFAGPDWKGEIPDGISKVFRSEGQFLLALGRTQVFGPADVEKAQEVMSHYQVKSLNELLGIENTSTSDMPELPPFDPVKIQNEHFIGYLNALMSYMEPHPSEEALFSKFAEIGVGPGVPFNAESLDEETRAAINGGIERAMEKIKLESENLGIRKNGWQLVAGAFGDREAMQGKYLTRAAAAYFGLWGNDLEEAFYPETSLDAENEPLDGSKHNYILHFESDELPPVNAFWSMTMYRLPAQLLVENAINRYKIGSATGGMKFNEDGSLDIYIQKDSPGKELETNWLPAYDGLFSLQSRFYWPKEEGLDPLYAPPAVKKR
ncbi:DUF1254 domain-containing protein [Fulvivirga sedimenti]|uniref:DUF1254 domain-containing protein n=1 Tax=Fulvivirga sedimenti TaxID=2879465 RepID=A0A9X1HU59_9BACT|nr:DUF1254 domain-containing protein [Fulvivirga sedimenti]MCA6078373.1 DUF1254 domain-containing protein [Fulvivirga sedimenti]